MNFLKNYPVLSVGIFFSVAAGLYEFFTRQYGIVWVSYLTVSPILLSLASIIYCNSRKVSERVGIGWVKRIEFFSTLILLVNIPGSLFLHDMGIQYDRTLHFLVGILTVFLAVVAVSVFYEKPKIYKKQVIAWAGLIVFFGLFIFELWQIIADNIFGSHLFFDFTQNISVDFWEDIIFGAMGLVFGAVLSYSRFNKLLSAKN